MMDIEPVLAQDQGASELVLDLRDNRGGLVSEGVEVARLFLDGACQTQSPSRLCDWVPACPGNAFGARVTACLPAPQKRVACSHRGVGVVMLLVRLVALMHMRSL